MKSNYIINGFQQTVQERFSAQSKALNEACMRRLVQLRVENTDASKKSNGIWRDRFCRELRSTKR